MIAGRCATVILLSSIGEYGHVLAQHVRAGLPFPPPSTAVRLGLGAELILQNQNASSLEDLDFSSDVQTNMIPPFASFTPSRLRAALCAVRGRPGSVRGLTSVEGSKEKTRPPASAERIRLPSDNQHSARLSDAWGTEATRERLEKRAPTMAERRF